MHIVHAADRDFLFGMEETFKIAGFEGGIAVLQLSDHFVDFFWVGGRVVFEIEFDFFDGFGEHELVVLGGLRWVVFSIGEEFVVNGYNFLEIQPFKVDVHSPYQKVNQISLFEFAGAECSEGFEHI